MSEQSENTKPVETPAAEETTEKVVESGAEDDNGVQKNDTAKEIVKRFPPTPPVPEGMTKSAWKRQLRREKWEAKRGEMAEKRREKKKRQREEKRKLREEREAAGIEDEPKKKPFVQQKFPLSVIIDCGFDDMMKEKERTSLAQQVTRAYASNKRNKTSVNLRITSLNKLLLERFEGPMKSQYKLWRDVSVENEDYIPDPETYVYLSSDSRNVIETLEEGKTYIIGGIVDKGRYKNLCKDKAEKQKIPTARLPIDQFIQISGRRVLTTNHVFEILLKYLEFNDWRMAFEEVLPQRKLGETEDGTKDLDNGDEDESEQSSEKSQSNDHESERSEKDKPDRISDQPGQEPVQTEKEKSEQEPEPSE